MGIVSSGETAVAWATEPPSGTYTIIMTAGTEMKKKAGVSIPGTAAFNAFSDFPYY
jgi:hypothetical protein